MVSFTEIKELIQHPAYIRFMEQVQKSSGVSIEETLHCKANKRSEG